MSLWGTIEVFAMLKVLFLKENAIFENFGTKIRLNKKLHKFLQ